LLGALAFAALAASSHAAFHGKNGKLVFARFVGSVERVFIANADGSHARRLSHQGQMDQSPVFTPNGKAVVFKSDRTGDNQLWGVLVNGSRAFQITKRPGGNGAPAFSPDGSKLVFESGEQTGNLKVTLFDKRGQRDLASGGGPAFSPNGRKIAYWHFRSGHWQLWVMDADGGHPHRLGPAISNYVTRPSYSPDGRRIAFQSIFRGFHQVYEMNSDGSHVIKLTKCGGLGCLAPVFSPDGRTIAYVTANANLYMMSPDGSHQRFVTRHFASFDFMFDWGVG
jgi:Tol biopolymer transport system component